MSSLTSPHTVPDRHQKWALLPPPSVLGRRSEGWGGEPIPDWLRKKQTSSLNTGVFLSRKSLASSTMTGNSVSSSSTWRVWHKEGQGVSYYSMFVSVCTKKGFPAATHWKILLLKPLVRINPNLKSILNLLGTLHTSRGLRASSRA